MNTKLIEKEKRIGKWIDEAKIGIMLTWGINSELMGLDTNICGFDTIEEFENEVKKRNWSPSEWVKAAKKMRASYITYVTFHTCMGYVRTWKSDMPGSVITKRDYLKELIEEASKENIKIVVYVNGDSCNSGFFNNKYAIDAKAYSEYKKDPSIDILNVNDFQRFFAKDMMEELLINYPEIAGFWFDGWNDDKNCNEVFGYLHEKFPDVITIRNNFGDGAIEEEDILSIECFGKKYEPDFDFSSGAWVLPGKAECCYVSIGDWWYNEETKPADHAKLVKKMITVIANGWVANMGFGPKIDGGFTKEIENYFEHLDRFFDWAGEAIWDTKPGGYEWGGIISGKWNNGAYGVSTIKNNKNIHFVHVLTPPKADVLILPDSGLVVGEVIFLKDNAVLAFEQIGGKIIIKVPSWDLCNSEGDAIIKITAAGEKISESYKPTRYLEELPASEIVEFESLKKIVGVIIEEDENSAITKGGWAAPDSNRMKDFKIMASKDGADYITVKEGTFENQRGKKQVSFDTVEAKYLKIDVLNAHNTSGFNVNKFSDIRWAENPLGEIGKDVISIAVERSGITWIVKVDGTIWNSFGHVWTKHVGCAQNIVVGNDNNVYMIESAQGDGKLFKWNRETWDYIGCDGKRVAVNCDGNAWVVKNDNSLWYLEGESLKKMEVSAHDVSISNGGIPWICGTDVDGSEGFLYHFENNLWNKVRISKHPKNIVVCNERLWFADVNGIVYGVYKNGGNISPMGHDAFDIVAGRDGSLWEIKRVVKGNLHIKRIHIIDN